MTATFPTYREAFNAAVRDARFAREAGRLVEWGLEKASPYYGLGPNAYTIFRLPRPENRQGHELRCQVVTADEPLMEEPRCTSSR